MFFGNCKRPARGWKTVWHNEEAQAEVDNGQEQEQGTMGDEEGQDVSVSFDTR